MKTAIQELIDRGALFVCNHSGGKDSQAMYLVLREMIPRHQLAVVHADLAEVEWAGAVNHIRNTIDKNTFTIAKAHRKDGGENNLLDMIERRGEFPSPSIRQCTSDLKRGPIERTIRALLAARQHNGLIVNCMGMRAQESRSRAKLDVFKLNTRNSKNGREWYDWLPIHDWTTEQVFAHIALHGQEPHPVYALGMDRYSCVFCVMASEHSLTTAARLLRDNPKLANDPLLYQKYVALEKSTGKVMMMPKNGVKRGLEEITGVKA